MASHHHGVAKLQAIKHLDLARAAQTQFDFNPLADTALRRVARQQPDDKLLAALRNNRFFRNHARVLTHTKHRIDPRKHAGAQLQLAVVNAAANADRTAIGVNQRVNRLNFCGVFAARQRVHIEHGGLAAFDFGLKAFWQPEVDENRINVFDVDDVSTVFQVVAHIDLANARNTVKRGNNFQTLCGRFGQSQLGLRNLQVGSAFVQ